MTPSDYLLFEEALLEILIENFPDRSRWDLAEADTWRLHELAQQRVNDKQAGLQDSKVLTEYVRTTCLPN